MDILIIYVMAGESIVNIDPIKAKADNLDHAVYVQVKNLILNHAFDPKTPIVQSQLSDMLQVSRTPLRKAMAQLESEGLLIRTPRGWYVQEITPHYKVSIFEIRAVLEGLAAKLAAPKIDSAQIAFMRAMFTEAFEAFKLHQNREPYYQADVKFHTQIVQIANDPVLTRTLDTYSIIATSVSQGLYRDPQETFFEHLKLVEALEQRDPELAEELMRDHVRKAIPVILSGRIHVPL
jgi:GntR family transcriptional regulator, vanillate catabolism transcriptional regulator